MTYGAILKNFLISLVPFLITAITLGTVWWYVVIHQQAGAAPAGGRPAATRQRGNDAG